MITLRTLAHNVPVEFRLRTAYACGEIFLCLVEASTRGQEVQERARDHSPMNNLNTIAGFRSLGVFLIILAYLHVLGLI